ncbi:MAG TPA: hypothetical protein VGI33_11820 [Paenibacillus sp.]|jgi:hypothetical protein
MPLTVTNSLKTMDFADRSGEDGIVLEKRSVRLKLSFGKQLRKHTLCHRILPQTAVYSKKFGGNSDRKDNPSA